MDLFYRYLLAKEKADTALPYDDGLRFFYFAVLLDIAFLLALSGQHK